MRFSVTFSEEQAVRLEALAQGAEEHAASTLVPLREISRLWTEDQRGAFARSGGVYGDWEPLSEGTVRAKQRGGGQSTPGPNTAGLTSDSPLVRTGALRDAATKRGAKGNTTRVTNDYFTSAVKSRTAHLQALGTRERVQSSTGRRTGRVPARPFDEWRPEMTERAVLILETWLTEGSVTPAALPGLSGGLVDLSGY